MLNCRPFTSLLLYCLVALVALGLPDLHAADVPTAAELQSVGLEIKWLGHAVLDPSRDRVRHVANDEDVIVVQSTAGVVSVFNAEDGRRRWAAQVGRNDEFAMPAVTNDRLVLIVAGPVLHGLDKFTGDEMFRHRLPQQPTAGPGIGDVNQGDLRDEYAYIPMTGGAVYAYDLKTLQHLERYGELPPQASRPFIWRFICRETILYPPLFVEESLAFVTSSRSLHIVDSQGGSLYQFLLKESSTAPLMAVRDGDSSSILMATGDNQLYSIKMTRPGGAKTKAQIDWVYPMERPITQRPVAVGNSVFAVTDGGGLYNIARDAGRPVQVAGSDTRTRDWYVPEIASVLSIAENYAYAVDLTNRLVTIDRPTGRINGRMTVDSFQHRHQNSLTDRLYLVSSAGEVLCLREPGSEFAVYHQNPGKQPIEVGVSDQEAEPANDK